MDISLAATDSGPLYTRVFYCGEIIINIFFTLNLLVPGDLYYNGHGAPDPMTTITNGGQCHIWRYSCNILARSPAPFGIINKYHINVNCIV